MKSKIIGGLFVLLILSGCLADEYYKDPISSSAGLSTGLLVPLIYADIDVQKLVTKYTNEIKYSSNGDITVFQRADSIKKFHLFDLYDIPQASILAPIPFLVLGSSSINDSISFPLSNGTMIQARSKIAFTIETSNFPYPVVLTITLKDISSSTQPIVTIRKELPSGNKLIVDSIVNADIHFTNNHVPIQLSLSKKNSNDVSNAIGTLKFTTVLSDLTYIKGTLQEMKLPIPKDLLNINMGVFRENGGVITYQDPVMGITTTNSTPFPVIIEPYFVGRNLISTDTILLETSPFPMNKRISQTEAAIDTTLYNKANSNILDFLAITPNILEYRGRITINPKSNQIASAVEMTQNDAVYLGYNLEFPVHITVKGLNVVDTIKFGQIEQLNKIEKARLKIMSINGFPFATKSVLQLCDSNLVVLDSLNLNLLKAAPVNPSGHVIESQITTNLETIELTEKKLANFKKTSNFILKTQIFTTDYNKNQVIIIQKNNRIKLQIGLGTLLNTDL